MCLAGHLQSMATPGPSAEEVDRKWESTQETMKFYRTIINIHSSFIRARPGDFQEGHGEEGSVLALESSQHSELSNGWGHARGIPFNRTDTGTYTKSG